jgi:hypothetical protein
LPLPKPTFDTKIGYILLKQSLLLLKKAVLGLKYPFRLKKIRAGYGGEGERAKFPDPDVFFICFLKYQGRDAEGGRVCEIPDPENSFLICFSFIA